LFKPLKDLKSTLLLILLSCCYLISHAQEKSIYGKVLLLDSNKPIALVNVTNQRSKQIVVTNDRGDFYIRAQKGDSIIISSVGFQRLGIKFDGINKEPVIKIKQEAIPLGALVVKDKKSENLYQEIQDFLNNPQDGKSIKNETLKKLINTNTSSGAGSVGVSIDALYELFSKEGKSKRKVAQFQYEDAKKFYAQLRYNKQVVSHITGLQNEQLDYFMKYCELPEEFILRATDYDLTYRILSCHQNLKKKF
jgi:hypothetical protein